MLKISARLAQIGTIFLLALLLATMPLSAQEATVSDTVRFWNGRTSGSFQGVDYANSVFLVAPGDGQIVAWTGDWKPGRAGQRPQLTEVSLIVASGGYSSTTTDLPDGLDSVAVAQDTIAVSAGDTVAMVAIPGNHSHNVWMAFEPAPAAFPVEWLSFEAVVAHGSLVELSWATAQEINSDHFEVERTTDGRDWTTIGQVDAAGWADTRSDYRFTDTGAPAGRNYYRLRQVDLDGAHDYSNVVEVSVATLAAAGPDLWITSHNGNPQVHGLEAGSTGTLKVYDLSGRLRQTVTVTGTGGPVTVSLPDLPAGLYFVRAIAGNKTGAGSFRRR